MGVIAGKVGGAVAAVTFKSVLKLMGKWPENEAESDLIEKIIDISVDEAGKIKLFSKAGEDYSKWQNELDDTISETVHEIWKADNSAFKNLTEEEVNGKVFTFCDFFEAVNVKDDWFGEHPNNLDTGKLSCWLFAVYNNWSGEMPDALTLKFFNSFAEKLQEKYWSRERSPLELFHILQGFQYSINEIRQNSASKTDVANNQEAIRNLNLLVAVMQNQMKEMQGQIADQSAHAASSVFIHLDNHKFQEKWDGKLFLEEDEPEHPAKRLKDVYILPSYNRWDLHEELNEQTNQMEYVADRVEYQFDLENQLCTYLNSDLQKDFPLYLFFGCPGIGKSTLISWLYNQEMRPKEDFLIYRFAEFADVNWEERHTGNNGRTTNTTKILEDMLRWMGIEKPDVENIEVLHRKVLILDGFDEIMADEAQRTEILRAFQKKFAHYCPVIVTCREGYLADNGNLDKENIRCFTLNPFVENDASEDKEECQISAFELKYRGNVDPEIHEQLCRNQGVFGIPLLLYVVLAVPELELRDGTELADIYDQIFDPEKGIYDRMVKRNWKHVVSENKGYDEEHTHFSGNSNGEQNAKLLLHKLSQEIAINMFLYAPESLTCSEKTADECKRKLSAKLNNNRNMDLWSLLSAGFYKRDYFGEVYEYNPGVGQIEFVHKSLYEYFTAVKIFETVKDVLSAGGESASDMVDKLHVNLAAIFHKTRITKEIEGYLSFKIRKAVEANPTSADDVFRQNLINISFWEQLYIDMVANGMMRIKTTDKTNETSESEETKALSLKLASARFSDYKEAERICFYNLVVLIQSVRTAVKDMLYQGNYELSSVNSFVTEYGHFPNCPDEADDMNAFTGMQKMLPEYLPRTYPGDPEMDLWGFNLSDLVLARKDFSGYSLRNCDLSGTDFRHAVLKGADLTDALLQGKCLLESEIGKRKPADFNGANLVHANADLASIRSLDSHKFQGNTTIYPMTGCGDFYTFGKWCQEPGKGETPLRWRILTAENGNALLITEELIEYQEYHSAYEDITWEECTLRKWLNDTFYKNAFNEKEKQRILVRNNITTGYEHVARAETQDRVFLLSNEEAEKFFENDEQRIARVNRLAASQKPGHATSDGRSWWWLRSPGDNDNSAAFVLTDGSLDERGLSVHDGDGCVRPALWISLKS